MLSIKMKKEETPQDVFLHKKRHRHGMAMPFLFFLTIQYTTLFSHKQYDLVTPSHNSILQALLFVQQVFPHNSF